MTTPDPAFCAAYLAIEQAHDAAHAEGHPLFIEQAMNIIEAHPETRRELEEISKELSFGDRSITDIEIAERLNMPVHFIRAFLRVIKVTYGDGEGCSIESRPTVSLN